MASGRRSFGRSSRVLIDPAPPPEGPEAEDSDDTPDEDSVADYAASLLSISVRRRRPAPAPQPVPVAPRRPATPPRPPSPSETWALARRDRPYPTPSDIDDAAITCHGYQGVLVKCAEDGRFLQVRRVFGSPLPAGGGASNLPRWEEQNTAMVLEWLSTLGREAVREGGPVEAFDVFPSRRAGVPWRAVVLPLSMSGDMVDMLLCCVRMEPER
ncbi:MAG TPA: hypothetical protein VF274_10585 [Alphaproteobacteria bacterium]|jgi:hypothetical protein